jgi:hypothetical protein
LIRRKTEDLISSQEPNGGLSDISKTSEIFTYRGGGNYRLNSVAQCIAA